MAPELAYHSLRTLAAGERVLDPMCGSGTVVRAAVEEGFHCVGVDIDPLAALMTRAWITPVNPADIRAEADHAVREAKSLATEEIRRTSDPETREFIRYWFAPQQEAQLARLATVLQQRSEPVKDALAVAFSRIVVTKEMQASLARDTSHSRPHRVATSNDFDVYTGFAKSAHYVAARLKPDLIKGKADILCDDARTLGGLDDGDFDLVLTSPPYLNAIDYLRGHRLTLVWLNHRIGALRETRSVSFGAERAVPEENLPIDVSPFVMESDGATIAPRHWGWIRRYACDMEIVLRQIGRVVKSNGRVILVLANSFLRGVVIDNAQLMVALAEHVGFQIQSRRTRNIPARRRYLPPPGNGRTALDARMREETILTFRV